MEGAGCPGGEDNVEFLDPQTLTTYKFSKIAIKSAHQEFFMTVISPTSPFFLQI
jgi:hypothetical protein